MASAASAALIDSTAHVVTPENIAFDYELAGPLRRVPAFLIDVAIRALLFIAVAVPLAMAGVVTLGEEAGDMATSMVLLLLWFVLEWFYGGLFETFWNGQTPGKRVVGLRVLTIDGQPINGLQAVLRNILRFTDMMPIIPFTALAAVLNWDPFAPPTEPPEVLLVVLVAVLTPLPTFFVAIVASAMNSRGQRLGDVVCGTMVVVDEASWLYGVVRMQDARVADLAAHMPPHLDVARSTAKALATYVERRRFFNPARRQEIATHLAVPLIERYNLPAVADYDLLLCAVYYQVFVSEGADEPPRRSPPAQTPILFIDDNTVPEQPSRTILARSANEGGAGRSS
jgi:uncharacterized RDD family membrane protein YckC